MSQWILLHTSSKIKYEYYFFFIHKHGDSGWLVVHTWTCKTLRSRSDDRITEKFNDRRNGPWYFRGPFYQYQHQLTFSTFIWQYFVGSRWICPMVMLDWDFIMEFTVVLNPKRYSFDLWPNCIARAPTYIGAVCCVWTQINKIPKLTHQKARGDLKNTLSSLQHRTMYNFHNSTDTLKFWTEKQAINKTFFCFSFNFDETWWNCSTYG